MARSRTIRPMCAGPAQPRMLFMFNDHLLRALSRSRTIATRPATPIHVPTRRIAADAPLTIRHANANDFPALERLAELDSHRIPSGELFVGEVDGRLLAALSIDTGSVIADPFEHTAAIVDVLRVQSRAVRPTALLAVVDDEPVEELLPEAA
jgi:hypothetical protein